MKPAKFNVFILGAAMIISSCQPKEDLSVVQMELTTFQSEWLESGSAIRQTLDSLKNDNQALHDLLVKMKKVNDSGTGLSASAKTSFDSLYTSVNHLKDSLGVELKNFNTLTNSWNQHKANLNQLVTAVESKSITAAEASEKLDDLKNVRTSAMNELQELQRIRDLYAASIKTCNSKFQKGFPTNITGI